MNRESRRALKKVEQQYASKAAKGVAIAATSNKWTVCRDRLYRNKAQNS